MRLAQGFEMGFENLRRHSCTASLEQYGRAAGQPAPGSPAWAMRLDQVISRGPFQPQLFCDCGTVKKFLLVTANEQWNVNYAMLLKNVMPY